MQIRRWSIGFISGKFGSHGTKEIAFLFYSNHCITIELCIREHYSVVRFHCCLVLRRTCRRCNWSFRMFKYLDALRFPCTAAVKLILFHGKIAHTPKSAYFIPVVRLCKIVFIDNRHPKMGASTRCKRKLDLYAHGILFPSSIVSVTTCSMHEFTMMNYSEHNHTTTSTTMHNEQCLPTHSVHHHY